MDFNLSTLTKALKSVVFLDDSGYQSVLERSQNNQYGTGWMIHQDMGDGNSDDADANWG